MQISFDFHLSPSLYQAEGSIETYSETDLWMED